jgi:lipopolysaccharide export system permease protein
MKIIFKLALFFSIALFILSLGLNPVTKQLSSNFVEEKKANVSINLNSSDFGQKFGDWSVIVDKKSNKEVNNVILYNRVDNHLIEAKKAYTLNENSNLQLILEHGKFYRLDGDIYRHATFSKMVFNDIAKNSMKDYKDIFQYWSKIDSDKKRLKEFVLAILISLMPIVFIYFIMLIGIVNPRNRNNYTLLYILFTTISYVVLIFLLLPKLGIYTILVVILFWITLGYYLYLKRIKSRY